MNREYSPETRERALRMLAETRPSHPTMMSAVRHVAGLLGMSPETLRLWQRRAEVGAGVKPGLTTDAAAEIKRLQKENAELRKANEILKAARVNSTRQRNSAWSLSAGVSKSSVFRGLEFRRAATASRSAWVRSFMLTPLGKY